MNVLLWNYLTSPTCWLVIVGSFVCTMALTPVVILVAHKTKTVRKCGYRRIHKCDTPLMGGVAIVIPFIAATFLATRDITGMFRAVGDETRLFYILIAGGACMGLLGLMDDIFKVRARHKLVVQILVALFVVLYGGRVGAVEIPLIGVISLQGWPFVGGLLAVCWIVGITNAVNLIDGMDGLATGVTLIVAAALAIVAGLNGSTHIVIPCLALIGSLAAFLWFNWHPAKIFLGDTGSLFLGFTLATIALLGSYKSTGLTLLTAALIALGIPIFETLVSMLRRYLGGFPVFAADELHTHHRLLRKGFTQRQVAVIMYVAAALCMVAAVMNAVPDAKRGLSLASFGIGAIPFLGIIVIAGYTQSIKKAFPKRRHTQQKMACADDMAQRLQQEPLNGQGPEFFTRICDEFDLCSLAICFCGEKPAGIVFQAPNGETQDMERRTRRFTLNPRNSHPVEVSYIHKNAPDETTGHTAALCLANIFRHASREHLIDGAAHLTPACDSSGFCALCDKKSVCAGVLTLAVAETYQTQS